MALGLALVIEATSSDTLAHAPMVPLPEVVAVAEVLAPVPLGVVVIVAVEVGTVLNPSPL